MDEDHPKSRHSVSIVRLTDEGAKKGLADALSRMGGLSSEAVLSRLDRLPWTLTRNVSREKAQRLVKLLKDFSAETAVDPPLGSTDAGSTPDQAAAQETRRDTWSYRNESRHESADQNSYSQTRAEETNLAASSPSARARAVSAKPTYGTPESNKSPEQTLGNRAAGLPESPTVDMTASESLPLEGILDQAFRIPRPESWLKGVVLSPGNVVSGTLRALAGTLDRSFDICRAHFWRLFGIAAIPWAIAFAIIFIAIFSVLISGLTFSKLADLPGWALVLIFLVTLLLLTACLIAAILLVFLPQAALIHTISEIHLGREIHIRQAYRFAYSRLRRFAMTCSLMMLVVIALFIGSGVVSAIVMIPLTMGLAWADLIRSSWVIGLVATLALAVFFGPMAYCLPRLLLFDKAVIVEDLAYSNALKRSWHLLSGRSGGAWYTSYYWLFGVLLVVSVPMQWAIYVLFQGPAWLISLALPIPPIVATCASQVLSSLGGLLSGVYVTATGVLFYYTVRNRKEGFDLVLLSGIDRGQGWPEEAPLRKALENGGDRVPE